MDARVHYHSTRLANAVEPAEGGGSLRSPPGSPRCAPAAPGGGTFDGQAYVTRLEAVRTDGSGSIAEPHKPE